MSEIIQLTETSRLLVETDTDVQCPRGDDHMLTGFAKIDGRGDSRRTDVPAVHENAVRDQIVQAHEHFSAEDWMTRDYRAGAFPTEDAVVRWARIWCGLVVEYDREHGGYWFVALDGPDLFAENFPDLVPGSPEHLAMQAEVIEQEREIYRQWAEGEVYGVILERRYDYVRPDDTSIAIQQWEDQEALWGCYLTDEYTAQRVALENFELDDEETEAVSA